MKRLTRAAAMLLACVLSLCVLTGCVSSGGTSYTDHGYVVSRGCSNDIDDSDALEELADKALSLYRRNVNGTISSEELKRLSDEAVNDAVKELKEDGIEVNYLFGYIEVQIDDDNKQIQYFDSKNLSSKWTGHYPNTILSPYLRDMDYYGVANDTVKGVNVIVAFFVR